MTELRQIHEEIDYHLQQIVLLRDKKWKLICEACGRYRGLDEAVSAAEPTGTPSAVPLPVKKRRSKQERRGILEEAIDYYWEHPAASQADIEKLFHLEQGALSKPQAQMLMASRKPRTYHPKRKK